jgi:cytoskeletal protein CcmA (bactofilin family)
MWKPSQSGSTTPSFNPEPSRPATPALSSEPANRAPVTAGDQASIGKGLIIKGEITGTESLFIDGKVEGTIALPGNRVTIGRNGQVASSIAAREIVILGKVRGNIVASDRVDIRAEGALTGDVTAARISIEDGAFFKGGIDIKKADAKPAADAKPLIDVKPFSATASTAPESPKPSLL